MSAVITALVAVASGLLVVAGAAKQVVPDGAMAALHRLRLPSGRVAARLLGLGEIGVGAAALLVGGRLGAGLVAASYAALLGVAAWQRSAQVDCGCFGTTATVVTRQHLAVNAAAALAGTAGLVWPPDGAAAVAADAGVPAALAGLVLLATGVGLVRAVIVAAAAAEAA